MDRFPSGTHVWPRSRVRRTYLYLYAAEDGSGVVSLSARRATLNAAWQVHLIGRHGIAFLLLRSAAYGCYLGPSPPVAQPDGRHRGRTALQRDYSEPTQVNIRWRARAVTAWDGGGGGVLYHWRDEELYLRANGRYRRWNTGVTVVDGNDGNESTMMHWTVEHIPPRPAPPTLPAPTAVPHVKLRRATEQINLLEGKLQQAVNENAKLKVKQTEDSKLWQGLDSKLSSTKTLCDQLTETPQQLASQTEQAEEDKKFFEEMLGKNSKDLDEFNSLLRDLSTKLEDAEQKIISGRQEMLQIKQEKEEMDRSYKERLYLDDTVIKEKDSLIKQLEGSVDENKSRLICLESRLQCMEQELKLNDDVCISLKGNLASSESEKNSLELMNKGHILEIEKLCQDNKDLKELLSSFVVKVTELDKEHASVSSHVSRLISSFERFYEMAQEEKMLMTRSSKDKFEHLQSQYVDLMSGNNALKTEIEETQEIVMVQHVEECQVAEDKIRRLESEAEVSASNINRLEKLASELQGRIQKLLEDSTLAENHKQKLLQKILKLESDNQELRGQVQEKSNNVESLQGEITKRDQQVNTLENQINQLHSVLGEKEQLYRCSVEREKTLEEQKLQAEASLSATECQLSEAKKQYDLMLEGEKIELSKHLKELSLKNDQVARIQHAYEHKESTLWDYHKQELQRIRSQAENELRELSLLRKEHELQIKSLRMHHEKECQRMQEELELQKSKQDDNIWDKRQIMYVFVLTTTAGLVFLLQPFLPVAYSRWIIMVIAAAWGIGSIGLPCGLFGTSRCEREFSRHTGRLVYTLFSVFVIYAFYLVAMRTGDTSASTPSPSLKEGAADINDDISWTFWFCIIGLMVLIGNLCSSIRGCWTGGDRDL